MYIQRDKRNTNPGRFTCAHKSVEQLAHLILAVSAEATPPNEGEGVESRHCKDHIPASGRMRAADHYRSAKKGAAVNTRAGEACGLPCAGIFGHVPKVR